MKNDQLIRAATAAIIMYEMLVSREGLSPHKKEQLQTTYLRSSGYKLISQFDLFLHPDGTTKSVKQQALINCYGDAIKAVKDHIINDMQHKEKVLLGLVKEGGEVNVKYHNEEGS